MTKISIITINYNNANGLQKTMESVFAQKTENFDYVIIDGGSTDQSLKIIQEHQEKLSYWVSEKDSGIYDAMNKGVKAATTDYVLFLNSGDYFYSDDVVGHLNGIISKADWDIVYGNLHVLDAVPFVKTYPKQLSFGYFVNDTLPFPCTLIKKSLIEKAGYFDENYTIVSDWKFFIHVFSGFKSSYFHTDKVLVSFDLEGISSKQMELVKRERNEILSNDFPFFIDDYRQLHRLENKMNFLLNARSVRFLKKLGFLKHFN